MIVSKSEKRSKFKRSSPRDWSIEQHCPIIYLYTICSKYLGGNVISLAEFEQIVIKVCTHHVGLSVDTKTRNKPNQAETTLIKRINLKTPPNQAETSESSRIKPNQAETTRIKPNQPKTRIFGFFHLIRLDLC